MFRSSASFLPAMLVSALFLAPLPPSLAAAQVAAECQFGVSAGTFAVPEFTGGNGFMSGDLYRGEFSIIRYHLEASLDEFTSTCVTCLLGRINGTLDDGVGPGPDFVVRGWYSGTTLNGSGACYARVFRTTGGPAVGTLRGSFMDSPVDLALGAYMSGWRICN